MNLNLLSILIKSPIPVPRVELTQIGIDQVNLENYPTRLNESDSLKTDSGQLLPINPKVRFEGNIYVLINGGTFSTAAILASKLYDSGIGTFVGTPVGGAYDGSSDGWFTDVILPITRLSSTMLQFQ